MSDNPYKTAMEQLEFDDDLAIRAIECQGCIKSKNKVIRKRWHYAASGLAAALVIVALAFIFMNAEQEYLQPSDRISTEIRPDPSVAPNVSVWLLSVPEMTRTSDLIAIGAITSDVISERTVSLIDPGSEIDRHFDCLFPGKDDRKPTITVQYLTFRIERVIYGTYQETSLTFVQYSGAEISLEKNQKALIFFNYLEDRGNPYAYDQQSFCPVGIFTIDDRDRLRSLSDNKYLTCYDEYKTRRLIQDIEKALKN